MTLDEVKETCENSLYYYAQIMFPERYFGDVHRDMFMFFQASLEKALIDGEGDNSAALIPRDHQKSFCIAVACTWVITKFPWFTVTYVSSNPTLSQRQLTIIKNVFKSDSHRELWPEMLQYEIHPRTKEYEHKPTGTWTISEIAIDHPSRPKSEKDPTVAATSAKSTNTGSHYKMCIFDDLVTNENYSSASERESIREVYQSYASIATTGSIKWMVGTRYGDNDLYADLQEKSYEVFDSEGDCIETKALWTWFERTVEDSKDKDGSGTFLWPRQKMPDGGWYGFNRTELSKKRSEAFNLELYYSQYYNDPNAASVEKITADCFMYMQPNMLEQRQGKWWYGTKELKIFCGMDLAFSEGTKNKKIKRDYTALAVVAWDADGYLYVLDLQRFQTDRAEVYYQKAIELHQYWDFRDITVETNAGGNVIANFIQDEVRKAGQTLVVKHQTKNQREGTKEERNSQLFEPLYRGKSVYHTKGGYTRLLEEELRLSKPPHDDLKDALWIAVTNSTRMTKPKFATNKNRNILRAEGRFLNRGGRRA
jgi:hypothetical protein